MVSVVQLVTKVTVALGQRSTAAAWLAAVVAGLVVLLLVLARDRARGSTLVPAWCWAGTSVAALAACELWLAWTSGAADHARHAPLRLLAAASTFCPLMAVLGARRPHHLAWQFIVVSLWAVLALPALETLLLARDSMDTGTLRGWFLWLLMLLGLLSYLPTRFAAAAILVFVGQIAILCGHLPGLRLDLGPLGVVAGLAVFLAALTAALRSAQPARHAGNEFDARWRRFRDMFGALWALRVLQRINEAAQMYSWPVALTWTGFYFPDPHTDWDAVDQKTRREIRQAMDNLLRRFV